MNKVSATLNRYSKFIAAIIGAVTEAINLGYVPHAAQNYVSMAVSILTALGVVGVSNGPAMNDGEAIANDLASLREQLGPLPKTGGLGGVAKWLAQLAEAHGRNLEAIVEAARVDLEDLIHQPVSMDPPTTEAGTLTISEPVQTLPQHPDGSPGDPPASEATTPTPEDPELTKLQGLIGS